MSDSHPNLSPLQAYGRIVHRLKHLGVYRKGVRVTFGLCLLLCALLAVAILALGAEALFLLPPAGRQILLALCGLGLLIVLVGFIIIPLVRGPSQERLAHLADARHPDLRNDLVTALQLWRKRQQNPEGYSTELMEAAVVAAEARSRDLDLRAAVERTGLRRVLRLGAILVGLAVILLVLFPAPLRTSAGRLSHPRTQFQHPPRTQLVVSPGDIQVTRHSDVLVRAQVDGRIPDQVRIAWQEGEARWRDDDCDPQGAREFSHPFNDLKRDIIYQVMAGDAHSPQYCITVIDRPQVVKLRLRYQYPPYTGLPPQVVEEDGNISAVVGTMVHLEVETNRDLASAWLSFSGDRREDLVSAGKKAEGRLQIRASGTYAIHLLDEVGNENTNPIQYRIQAVADEPPMVQITFPAENVDMGEEMKLPLSFVAQDDFGLSRAALVHRTIREGEQLPEEETAVELPGQNLARAEVNYLWDLTALGLVPEDLVAYRVVVWDNDGISGPKKGETPTYTVRFPSIHEILAQVQQEQSAQIEEMEEMVEEERLLKERLDQIRRELETEDAISWEMKKDVEMTLEQQEEMAKELAEIAQKMDENLQRAQENRVASMEIMEKMDQVRQLMEEVATPEMRQALEDLRKALQELDPELVKEHMDQFNLTQEDLLKRLDRTLSMLKRLQAEQRMDALIKKAEDLLHRQQDLVAATEKASPENLADLAQKQQALKQDLEALPDEMNELADLMEQFPEMPAAELAQMAQDVEASELPQQMAQASQKLSSGNQKGAKSHQEQAAEMLQKLNQELQSLQSQMGGRMQKEVVDAIKGSIRDLLDISQRQEDHRSAVQELGRESTQFGRLAEGQLGLLEAGTQVANDLYDVAQKTFFVSPQVGQAMGQALSQMREALNSLEGRNGSAALDAEKSAMVALNEAAQQLIKALNAMSNSCSSGGMEAMMQQLQGMAQQQMGINQQTLGLSDQSQLSMEQRAQMARLAGEQAAVQRQLDQLLQEFGNRSEILGRLDQLGEEMKKVVDDLARRQVDQQTLDRQQKILSRLLDAQKSARRRDYTRRRQSRPGQVTLRRSPGELPAELEDAQERLRRDLLEALAEDYPKAYEELIRAYFQALSRTE